MLRSKTTDEGTKSRAANRTHTPDPDRVGTLRRLVDISHSRASSRKDGRAKEASEETEGEQHAKVLGIYDSKLEEYEHDQGADVNRVSSEYRDL